MLANVAERYAAAAGALMIALLHEHLGRQAVAPPGTSGYERVGRRDMAGIERLQCLLQLPVCDCASPFWATGTTWGR